MNIPRRDYHGDYYGNRRNSRREGGGDNDDWANYSYGEMGLNDDTEDYASSYGTRYHSPTRTTVPSTPPSASKRKKHHQQCNKNINSRTERSPKSASRPSSPSNNENLTLTPLGSMTKKLLRSPGSMKRMLLSGGSGKQRRRQSTGGRRKSLKDVRGDDLLRNPKLYDQLNDADKGRLNQLLSKEFGLDPL